MSKYKTRKLAYLIVLISLIQLISGCMSLSGKIYDTTGGAAEHGSAVLKINELDEKLKQKGYSAVIARLDDKHIGNGGLFSTEYPAKILLTPGVHRFTVHTYNWISTRYADFALWVNAEAGRSYTVKVGFDSAYYAGAMIVDDETGAAVGGLVGSTDEPKNLN